MQALSQWKFRLRRNKERRSTSRPSCTFHSTPHRPLAHSEFDGAKSSCPFLLLCYDTHQGKPAPLECGGLPPLFYIHPANSSARSLSERNFLILVR